MYAILYFLFKYHDIIHRVLCDKNIELELDR